MSELVFISFSEEDIEFVASIPAWTFLDIPPGESIFERIERALDNCKAFLVVLSHSSTNSRWVRWETHAAHQKLMKTGLPTMIPILLDDCDIPSLLEDVSYIDCRGRSKASLERLVAQLHKLLDIGTTSRDELKDYWLQKYRDGTTRERQAAIEVLFSIGTCEETTVLLGDVELQDEPTKRGIAKRLPYYLQSYFVPHYKRLAASDDPVLSPSAWLCLANLGDRSAFQKLLALSRHSATEMKQNALRNIPRVEGITPEELRDAARAIRACLSDAADPRVQQTALDTAMKLKGALVESGRLRRSVIAEVRRLLNNPNSEVARLAEHAFRYLDS